MGSLGVYFRRMRVLRPHDRSWQTPLKRRSPTLRLPSFGYGVRDGSLNILSEVTEPEDRTEGPPW